MTTKEMEERELATETYSQSSEEEVEEDDDEELEDLEDNDSQTSFWKEHWIAFVVALAAAVVYQAYTASPGALHGLQRLFPSLQATSATKHEHLDQYARMANVSFCLSKFPQIKSNHNSKLQPMEFYIPRELFQTLKIYYQADEVQDDYYEHLTSEEDEVSILNEEYHCLFHQQESFAESRKFKGITNYYPKPTMEEIYPELADSNSAVVPRKTISRRRQQQRQPPLSFTGFAAKFVNLSPKPVLLYWDGKGGHENSRKLVGEIAPFEAIGTATNPGHGFHVTPTYDSSTVLQRWVVTADTALVYYEPHTYEELHGILLSGNDRPVDYAKWAKYQSHLVNQAFARDYLVASQRIWLAHFPRPFPMQFMHAADYIGQEHRMGDFVLKVASVTPRVFVIDNFLTPAECDSIVKISQQQGMELSTLHSGTSAKKARDTSTRSSTNTWLQRDTNALTNKVYLQAAEVMGLNPELFQKYHHTSAQHHSIAESLQVVRYKAGGEEYQPHHDFVYPSVNHRYQPSRFATLLIYLNDVPEGGETRFPRAVNNYNAQGLEIKPTVGQAVLFYNLLEDGNVDDLSQHGSNPTTEHEKWLANLW